MEDLIDAHLDWCRAAGMSPNTIVAKRQALHAAQRGMPFGLAATDRDLVKWLSNERWAPRTRAANYAHLVTFYDWAVNGGELDWSPMRTLRKPKVPPSLPQPWSDAELSELLRRARQPWHLAVVLAAFAGMRCCEIAALRPSDVSEHVLRVAGKGGKVAEIDVHPRVAAELALFPGPGPYLVQAGGRADARWLSRKSWGYFHHTLNMDVHLHQGRHWFVTNVYEQAGEAAAQQAARHSSIATTQGYMALRNGQRRRGILALPVLDEVAS